jgi:hypothetical protein
MSMKNDLKIIQSLSARTLYTDFDERRRRKKKGVNTIRCLIKSLSSLIFLVWIPHIFLVLPMTFASNIGEKNSRNRFLMYKS